MPFPADAVANLEVGYVGTDLDDLADKLMAYHERHGDRLLRPGVPLVNVEVRSTDTRCQHADLNVVDTDLRLRHIFNPETTICPRLYKSFHISPSGVFTICRGNRQIVMSRSDAKQL